MIASAPPWSVPNLDGSRHLRCDITGNMQELPIKLYGLLDVHGGDDHVLVAQEALLGELHVYEELTVDSVVWARSNGDAWEPRTGEAPTIARLRRSIEQAAGWTNLGLQQRSGQATQRMKAAGSPVEVSDFGFTYPDG
jgi:hypothetical protein